jgi:hypothetical protein
MIPFPTPEEIHKLECASLALFGVSKRLQEKQAQFAQAAQTASARLKDLDFKHFRGGAIVDFEGHIEIDIDGSKTNPHKIFLSERINANIIDKKLVCTDSSFCVALSTSTGNILRKFHFDFDSGIEQQQKKKSIKKPYFHVQYGGELSKYMIGNGIDEDTYKKSWHPWLETPRITYFPMSIFILLYIVLKEFAAEDAHLLFEESYWGSHLKSNEAKLIKPFIDYCQNTLKADKSLFKDCYYHT